MESNGVKKKIHMSNDTAQMLLGSNTFQLSDRGEIPIKGKGMMRTWFLDGTSDDDATEQAIQFKCNQARTHLEGVKNARAMAFQLDLKSESTAELFPTGRRSESLDFLKEE